MIILWFSVWNAYKITSQKRVWWHPFSGKKSTRSSRCAAFSSFSTSPKMIGPQTATVTTNRLGQNMDFKKSTHVDFIGRFNGKSNRYLTVNNQRYVTVCDYVTYGVFYYVLLLLTRKGTTYQDSFPNNGRKTHQRLLVDLTIDDWRMCVGLHSTGQPLHKNTQTLATLLQPWLVLIQYTHGVGLHIISPAQKKN